MLNRSKRVRIRMRMDRIANRRYRKMVAGHEKAKIKANIENINNAFRKPIIAEYPIVSRPHSKASFKQNKRKGL